MESIKDIDTSTKEGKYLMSALARLTVTVDRDIDPDTCLRNLKPAVDAMYPPKKKGLEGYLESNK